MHLLSLILNQCSDYMLDRLNKEIDSFKKEGIVVEKHIHTQNTTAWIQWDVRESTLKNYTLDDFKNIFKHYMANAFTDIIICDMGEKLVHKIIQNQYAYFTPQEREEIIKHLESIQEQETYYYGEEITYKISRKAKILQRMMDYLGEYDEVVLEGFIRFRLKDYIQELEDGIEKAVEDFLMEKEYNEFIRLLRYFVDIQEAKIDTVNVLMSEDGKYHLYDKLNRMINNEHLEDLATEMADKDISYDDLLISSMITLAPKKIIIHFVGEIEHREIIETIKNVFSNKVYICGGCDLCVRAKNAIKE